MTETERLLWNFISATRAMAEADTTPDAVTKERAMKQADEAVSELAKALDAKRPTR